MSLEGYGILGESDSSSPSVQAGTVDKLGEFLKMAAFEKQAALDKLAQIVPAPVLGARGAQAARPEVKVTALPKKKGWFPEKLPQKEIPVKKPLPTVVAERPKKETLRETGKAWRREEAKQVAERKAITEKKLTEPLLRRMYGLGKPAPGEPAIKETVPLKRTAIPFIGKHLAPTVQVKPRGRELAFRTPEEMKKFKEELPTGLRYLAERAPGKEFDPATLREAWKGMKGTLKERMKGAKEFVAEKAKGIVPHRIVGQKAVERMTGVKPGLITGEVPIEALGRGREGIGLREAVREKLGPAPKPPGFRAPEEPRGKRAPAEAVKGQAMFVVEQARRLQETGKITPAEAAARIEKVMGAKPVKELREAEKIRKIQAVGVRPGEVKEYAITPPEIAEKARRVREAKAREIAGKKAEKIEKPFAKQIGKVRKERAKAEVAMKAPPVKVERSIPGTASALIEHRIASGKLPEGTTPEMAGEVARKLRGLGMLEQKGGMRYEEGAPAVKKILKGTPFADVVGEAARMQRPAATERAAPGQRKKFERTGPGEYRQVTPEKKEPPRVTATLEPSRVGYEAPTFQIPAKATEAERSKIVGDRERWHETARQLREHPSGKFRSFDETNPDHVQWMAEKSKGLKTETGIEIPSDLIKARREGGRAQLLTAGGPAEAPAAPAPTPEQMGAFAQMMQTLSGGFGGPQLPPSPQAAALPGAAPAQIPANLAPLVQRLALMQGGQAEGQPAFQQAMQQVGARGQMPGWLGLAGSMAPLMLAQSMGLTGLAPTMGALIGGPMAAEGLARRLGWGPERMQQAQQAYLRGPLSEEEYSRQLGQVPVQQTKTASLALGPMDWSRWFKQQASA